MPAERPLSAFARNLAHRRELLGQRDQIIDRSQVLRSSAQLAAGRALETVFRSQELLHECVLLRRQIAAARAVVPPKLLLRADLHALDSVE